MQRKHRCHRHHKDSKHKHVSKVKNHHKSGHKHHKHDEEQHVSFIDPAQSSKVDKNGCGDFEPQKTVHQKHSIKRKDQSESTKDEKQKNAEKYLKELTKLQPGSITKHHSLDRQNGSFIEQIFKRDKSSPANDGNQNKQVKVKNVSKEVSGKTQHKCRHRSQNKETKHKDEKRKQENEKKDLKEHKQDKHTFKASPDRICDSRVQNVLFYQIKPQTPFNQEKGIKDLYHHEDRKKSHERKITNDESLREHRHRSKEERKGCFRHNPKEDVVKSMHKEKCVPILKNEKLIHKARHKSAEKEHSKSKGEYFVKEAKERQIEDNVNKKVTLDIKKKTKHRESNKDTAENKVSFEKKIEDNLKNYFSQIQTMIDKKFELLLKNSKLKVNEAFKTNDEGKRQKVLTIRKIRRSKSADRDSKIIEVIDSKGKVIKLKLNKSSKLKGSCRQESSEETASPHHKVQKIFQTVDEKKLKIDKKRKRKEESKQAAMRTEQLNSTKNRVVPEFQINHFPPFGSETEDLSKMTSEQSKFTNYSFRRPEPPYEWLFPPELWSLKFHDFILASQQNRQFHMPPPACSSFSIPNHFVSNQERPSKITKTDFFVQDVEPPSLDKQNIKSKKHCKNLECKTVSVIGIQPEKSITKPSNDIETQKTISDDLVEKRKKSKRFKVYYKYSTEKQLHRLSDGSSTCDNVSVISDSFKPFNEKDENFIPKKLVPLQQQLVQNICIKPREKATKIRKEATPNESILNNIIEEPTNSSLNFVTQCYFKNLSTSNSESCIKVNKKAAHSSISIKSSKVTKKVCKHCTRHKFRSKSDTKITFRDSSKILKSKSDIVLDSPNAKQVVKPRPLSGGHPVEKLKFSNKAIMKNFEEKKIVKSKNQECQTFDDKEMNEEYRKDQEVYERKKKHIKEIYKTIEYLEGGIQTVGETLSCKKVVVDVGVGNYNFLDKTKDKNMLKKDVATEYFEGGKPTFKTVIVKDMLVGEVDNNIKNHGYGSPELNLKTTVCSEGSRRPKSPIRPRQNSYRVARKADVSPPKPVPRKSLLKSTYRTAVPPTQVVVFRKEVTDPPQEQTSRNIENKNTPCCSTRPRYKSPSTRQPSNVEELFEDVTKENKNKGTRENMEVQGDRSKGNTAKTKAEDHKTLLNSLGIRQNRPTTPAGSLKTKPFSHQNTYLEKNSSYRSYARSTTKNDFQEASPEDCHPLDSKKEKIIRMDENSQIEVAPESFKNNAKEATPKDCCHVFSPKEKTNMIDANSQIKTNLSVNRVELEPLNTKFIKRVSESLSSSVEDTVNHKRVNFKEPYSTASPITPYQEQIYSHTPTSLINEQTKTLKKFITEPSAHWHRPKSYVQSLDRYEEKHKSTLLLTKQDKIRGQSSYQKRKIYDAYRREQMKNHFKVYYSINNVITDNLTYGEYKGNFVRQNSAKISPTDSTKKIVSNPNLANDQGDGIDITQAKIPSVVTLFMKKDDDNLIKLCNFCQKLININSSMEFPFNFNDACPCNNILRDCQACKKFLKNLGAFFTEAAYFSENDEPEFVDHFVAEINLDNEFYEFYNNNNFIAESLIENSSLKFDKRDVAPAKSDDMQKELFPENLNNTNMENYIMKSDQGSSLESTNLIYPLSCPDFQNYKTDFKYLYDASDSSSSKESNGFSNLVHLNLNQYNVETFANNVGSGETTGSSGYESESKPKSKTASHLSFFKKPNIAALFKPCLQANKSKIRNDNEDSNVEIFGKNSNARKVREWKQSSDNFEEFKEIPLHILLSRNNTSIFEYQDLESNIEIKKECCIYENNSNAQDGYDVYLMEEDSKQYMESKVSKDNLKEKFKDSKISQESFVENLKEIPSQNKEVMLETKFADLCDNMEEIGIQDITEVSEIQEWEYEPEDKLYNEDNFLSKVENKLVEIKNSVALLSENKQTSLLQRNPFLEMDETQFDEEFCSKSGCKVDFVNEILKVRVVIYFVPEIFQEVDNFEKVYEDQNNTFFENCEEKISLDDLPKITPSRIPSEHKIAKKFFDSILHGYNEESAICTKIYNDQNFWKNEVFSLLEKKKSKEKKTKKKGFGSFFRRKTCEDSLLEENYSSKKKPSQIHLARLQDLASKARRCFSMLVDAVKINKNIDEDEIKFCAILKMLKRIETGDFEVSKIESNNIPFENLIKQQIIDAFSNTFEICQREAKKHKRRLGDTEVNLIKCFVSRFRAGLLSRTDIVPVYVGRGLIRTETQLKAAVTFIMRSNSEEINQREFEEFCEITQIVSK